MQFYIDHDWQENMAAPRPKVGERAKTHLLLFLCAIWLFAGLIGHSPWKPFESSAMSVIQGLIEHPFLSSQSWLTGAWLAPTSAGHPSLDTPPLFYWVATAFVHVCAGWLPAHDATRLTVGLWMLVTLTMIGMTGRELWNIGIGRQTNFIFIGCIGLVVSAHTILPAIASLCGLSITFYAYALVQRKPQRAMLLLALGLMISFLTGGVLPALSIVSTAAVLIAMFPSWRSPNIRRAITGGLLLALPLILAWCYACYRVTPTLWHAWWDNQWIMNSPTRHVYFLRTLAWFAWPALPFAIWGIWRYRSSLLTSERFQLCIVFFVCSFIWIGLFADRSETNALPLLLPLTALAAGSIETLKRGAAGAINWFGLILFCLLIAIAWLGWWAMLNGYPVRLYERLRFLSGLKSIELSLLNVAIAVAATMMWLSIVFRSKHSNRSSATHWAIGMTCSWAIFMSLWLPMIEAARTYQPLFEDLKRHLPSHYLCITSKQLGTAQIDLLHYHANVRVRNATDGEACDVMLIADEPGKRHALPGDAWVMIWQGEQSRQSKESYRLFQKNNPHG